MPASYMRRVFLYFNAKLKVKDHMYLVESLSRSLISLHIPSGKVKIEARLPWKYNGKRLYMFSWKNNIVICSPVMDHFLFYDFLEQQIKVIELQEIEADEAGAYFSNVLMDQEDFILLPFKGKTIKKYGINGKLKSKDNEWHFPIDKEYNHSENVYDNIRMESACIVGRQLFFSLVYGNQNYLCRYGLNKEKHLCSIEYNSGNIAIRGIYAYYDTNTIVFRRIFHDKTEIVLIPLDAGQRKIVEIDYPSVFSGDVYGDFHHLNISLKKGIIQLEGHDLNVHKTVYDFKDSDVYIAEGIVINIEKNEILIADTDNIMIYSIKEVVEEIKTSCFYQKEYRELLGKGIIEEERYNLWYFKRYIVEQLSREEKNIEDKNIGKLIWKISSTL